MIFFPVKVEEVKEPPLQFSLLLIDFSFINAFNLLLFCVSCYTAIQNLMVLILTSPSTQMSLLVEDKIFPSCPVICQRKWQYPHRSISLPHELQKSIKDRIYPTLFKKRSLIFVPCLNKQQSAAIH